MTPVKAQGFKTFFQFTDGISVLIIVPVCPKNDLMAFHFTVTDVGDWEPMDRSVTFNGNILFPSARTADKCKCTGSLML